MLGFLGSENEIHFEALSSVGLTGGLTALQTIIVMFCICIYIIINYYKIKQIPVLYIFLIGRRFPFWASTFCHRASKTIQPLVLRASGLKCLMSRPAPHPREGKHSHHCMCILHNLCKRRDILQPDDNDDDDNDEEDDDHDDDYDGD